MSRRRDQSRTVQPYPFRLARSQAPHPARQAKKVVSSQYPVVIAFARHPVLARSLWLDGGMEVDVYVVDCIYRHLREKSF
jgi:hypothetical protein